MVNRQEIMGCESVDMVRFDLGTRASRAGDYNLHHVCTCVRAFSLKALPLHIFGKLLVLMNFYALQYFGGLVNLAYF